MFSKEAMYASRKMRSRLAAVSESALTATLMASYLRRKDAQGKAALAGDDTESRSEARPTAEQDAGGCSTESPCSS
jgi:hypothetical protein